MYLDQPDAGQERMLGDAVRQHFAREAQTQQRKLRRLFRRGLVSLAIGLLFLGLVFLTSEGVHRMIGQGSLALLLEQGLIIVGWVAMWRPLEIFLYDWWPIVGERRIRAKLSVIPVRIAPRTG